MPGLCLRLVCDVDASLGEVLERRFARLEKEDPDRASGEWPDLLLIDGGKGQLSAVCEVMEDAGVHDVPVVGVAKGPHHGREGREVFHLPGGREITLPPNGEDSGTDLSQPPVDLSQPPQINP